MSPYSSERREQKEPQKFGTGNHLTIKIKEKAQIKRNSEYFDEFLMGSNQDTFNRDL